MSHPTHLLVHDAVRDDSPPEGSRKLIRPRLADKAPLTRTLPRRRPEPLLAHQELAGFANAKGAGGQAELFYFQKQIQTQTPMVFVLEGGETIEGIIEWYDQHVIKIKRPTRTMIYKSSIKYLFKASESRQQEDSRRL